MRMRGYVCAIFTCAVVAILSGCAALQPNAGAVSSPAVLASVPVGEGPTLLAVSPDGSRVYAAANAKLSVIDTADNRVLATLPIDPYPAGLALTPDGKRAFVSSLFSVHLVTVDLVVDAVLTPIDLFADRFRGGFGFIAVTPDGKSAWVANQANQVLGIVGIAKADTNSQNMDMRPVDIAITPNGRAAYIAGCKNFCATGTVEVLDTRSLVVTASITIGSNPYRVKLSADGTRAYTTNLGAATVSVIDVATNSVTATVPVPVEPTGLAVSPDGALTFVASQPAGTISVINNTTNEVQAKGRVAGSVRDVVVTPDGKRLYVSTRNSVVVVDVQTLIAG